jgi:integrase/recombinase XerD
LIAAAIFQMTASSPCGTFSPAELTEVWVITRYHPVLSVPAATIRGMAGDQEMVTAAAAVAAGGELVPRAGAARPPGPAVIAAELLARTRAELPVLAGLGEREELLAAAWLASLRAARTRRAYAADVRGWLGWLTERGTDVLDAGRVHVDLWAAAQQDRGAESSTVRRRLSALSSFYRYCAAHDLVDRIPTAGVARPMVDPDYTATIGLDRDQARALVAAADADKGPQALRTAAVIRLLLHNGLRVDEACAADVANLGTDAGHRVLRVIRKGARKARIPLTPATAAALDAYLAERACRGGLSDARQLAGPLLATASGGRLRQGHLWGTGAPPGPRRGHPGLGPAIPALPAALGDHLRARRRRRTARRAGLRRSQGPPHYPPVRPCPGQPGPQRRLRGRGLPRLTGHPPGALHNPAATFTA